MADKTNYAQSLTHLIKGNLGAGILAMPASFAHTGLVGAIFGLPLLCLISTYCVHILVKSAQLVESKSKGLQVNYSNLARQSFEIGPNWIRGFGNTISSLLDTTLLVTQVGVCCVYIVFVVDNVTSVLASYNILISKSLVFLAILPVTLLLSFIRTLNRLAVASLLANLLQAIGLALIVEYLVRDIDKVNLNERDNFRPISEMALGFGSAMFAFEGISVVLPVYSRMRNPKRMSGCLGVVNISYIAILILYFIVGILGYLKFGHHVRDSITLNLPAEPLYDAVRLMFTASILLTYPLQFYVPNEIVWELIKKNLLKPSTKQGLSVIRAIEVVIPPVTRITETIDDKQIQAQSGATSEGFNASRGKRLPVSINNGGKTNNTTTTISYLNDNEENTPVRYEYYCRVVLVITTFTLAFSVPKLNLLMDLIGSFSGAALSLTIPAMIHLAAYWNNTMGVRKAAMIIVDSVIISLSLTAGLGGSISSLVSIAKSFR